jgi:nicotinamide phosphoribosyltransferase
MMKENNEFVLDLTDSYKHSHAPLYPAGTQFVASYFEARSGRWAPYTVFYGLQYILEKYLAGKAVTQKKIDEGDEIVTAHMGQGVFNREGWEYILDEYNGALPVQIRAVPEGSKIPVQNVLMTVENTDPRVPWLTSWLETILVQLWYPCTVATQSYEIRRLMDWYAEETGDKGGVPFKLHDFGFRGVSSVESAAIGGSAHLLSFLGTDTMTALRMAREYYGAKMAGFSIPASEHSTMSAWLRDGQTDAMRNMLQKYPNGVIACVSDTWDIFAACRDIWGGALKNDVMNRNGTLVVRPDSGNPLEVVMTCLETLGEKFGFTVNDKGYKVLDPHVRLIQGDGVDKDLINAILGAMKHAGWSIDNIAFGMGGALLQKLNRDTMQFAFKCCAAKVDGQWRDVYKDPITSRAKRSKAGLMKLVKVDGTYKTVPLNAVGEDVLETVFDNGKIVRTITFDEIRERLMKE